MSTRLLHPQAQTASWAPTAWASSVSASPVWASPVRLREPGLLSVAAVSPVGQREVADPGLLIGRMGVCDVPCLFVLVTDDSPSVTGGSGADPLANRYTEARAALRALAKACTCGLCLAGVVHFDLVGGTDPVPVRHPRAWGRRLHPRVEAALRVPDRAVGSSVLGPALERAQHAVRQHPDRLPILIVASDFHLFDTDPAVVIAGLDRFARTVGDVHALVLGHPLPDGVLSAPIRTHLVRPGSAPGSLARALARGLVEHRPAAAILDDPDEATAGGR